jgi:hypothetical protein
MNLPPFVFALAFWEGMSLVIAGVAALLVFFGVIPADYALGAGGFLGIILSILRFFKVNPELRAKGLK